MTGEINAYRFLLVGEPRGGRELGCAWQRGSRQRAGTVAAEERRLSEVAIACELLTVVERAAFDHRLEHAPIDEPRIDARADVGERRERSVRALCDQLRDRAVADVL